MSRAVQGRKLALTPLQKQVLALQRSARPPTAAQREARRLERERFEAALAAQIEQLGLPMPVRQARLVPGREFAFDFAWPDQRLACEVDGGLHSGGRHVRGAGAERDAEKYSLAAAEGYRVVRVSTGMVKDGRAVELVARALAWHST
ncbi:MAG: DUF559 domain-containing protein [Actinomycetota bacterium]|jgi:very-short-patch-repair endonuclease|nr:DUF559 domain-containing protein [Actinomycetota bacterium]